jgi:hypothetical protein
MKALIVKVDGTAKVEDIEINNHEAINAVVGGWIEMVNVGKGFMYVNEEGKLNNLPLNPRMTKWCLQGGHIHPDDFIVGNCVIVGDIDEEGYHGEVNEELVKEFLAS